MRTLGKIAKSHGFDNLGTFVDKINDMVEVIKSTSFEIGDKIELKKDYTPTHFNYEKILPFETVFIIKEKSNFILGEYSIKVHGYDVWFKASVFQLTQKL